MLNAEWWKRVFCCIVDTLPTTFWPSFHIILYFSFELLTRPSLPPHARCHKKHTLSFSALQTNGKKIERLMFYIHILEVVNVNVCECIQFLARLHSEWPFPSLTTMNLFNLLTIYFFVAFDNTHEHSSELIQILRCHTFSILSILKRRYCHFCCP